MPEPVTDYTPEQLAQAARESRAWAGLARAHADLHAAQATTLQQPHRRVALALADVSRRNAAHAEAMASLYEAAEAACRSPQ
jgi:hypothetical protein